MKGRGVGDVRGATGERVAHGGRARLDRRPVRELELAVRHVHVRVHVLDRARHWGEALAHQRLRAVDLLLGDDRVRREVGNLESGATMIRWIANRSQIWIMRPRCGQER